MSALSALLRNKLRFVGLVFIYLVSLRLVVYAPGCGSHLGTAPALHRLSPPPLLVADTKLKFPSLRSVIFVKCRPRSEFRGGVVPSCSPPLGKVFCEAPAICVDEDSPGSLWLLQTVPEISSLAFQRSSAKRTDVQ